ncbi:hypothetical protein [Streptomyces sp. NBC_01216]|uniref:hypothetical protein n=1 Tax=unclassified Streptomyces TaxID=2593676 RepID=UPI002E14F7D4|nr:hypothetical protein OG393_14755 [Streptomyces sp. NBC_01216]
MRRQRSLLAVVALCLGGAVTACGGGGGEGYAAVGAGAYPKGTVPPSGTVTLVPLDGPSAGGTASGASPTGPRPPGASTAPDSDAPGRGRGAGSRSDTDSGPRPGGSTSTSGGRETTTRPGEGTSAPSAPSRPGTSPPGATAPPSPGTTSPAPPPVPAALTVSAPIRTAADKRWCERVTVAFHNTGGSSAASGTVTFATHVIGSLGIDWATVTSSQPLPAPIAAGATRTRTYTVCLDSWRVPLGMHVDTRGVTATWR